MNKETVCKKEGKVFNSWRPDKKKVVCVDNKLIHFGQKGYKDFTQHKDESRKKSFRARHDCDNAKDKTTPRYWACEYLWGDD
jgi:hypothetical protein